MTEKEYRSHPENWWIGKIVRNTVEIQNGYRIFPAGQRFKITRKYMGFDLRRVEYCKHCGVGRIDDISRANPEKLELVEVVRQPEQIEIGKEVAQ